MPLPFKVNRVTPSEEETIFHAKDRFSACVFSMSKNSLNFVNSMSYIVVPPRGKRMSIAQQRRYLSFSQEYSK